MGNINLVIFTKSSVNEGVAVILSAFKYNIFELEKCGVYLSFSN